MRDVELLTQALPYMRRHRKKTFLVKLGGALVERPDVLARLAKDVSLLVHVGIRVCVVHGGGPQASKLAERLGVQQQFIDGRRITDAATLEVTKMVFAGKINLEIQGALRRESIPAVGLSGMSGDILRAVRRKPTEFEDRDTGEKRVIDMGHVGDVKRVNTRLLRVLMKQGYVPVVSSLGADKDGNVLNINADTVAMELAVDLGAHKLLQLTNVDGILRDRDDPSSLISELTVDDIEDEITAGVIAGGMIPKVRMAAEALRRGVKRVHMLNGERPHSLLTELFTREGAGTLITKKPRKPRSGPLTSRDTEEEE